VDVMDALIASAMVFDLLHYCHRDLLLQ
jgi:hypothetical protein